MTDLSTLVLLTPIGLDAGCWERVPLPSAPTRRHVFPGFGSRPRAREQPTVESLADEVADSYPGALDVVGVSMGAMVAQNLALRHPERVRSLVVACTGAAVDRDAMLRRAQEVEAKGMAAVLDAAHAVGLHHHALSPSNVFVGPAPDYAVRITDFGSAVVRSASPTHEAYVQAAPWWAPEQLQPASILGPATDVFTSGLIAFFALTGRSYWRSCQTSPPDLTAWQNEIMGARVGVSQRARDLGAVIPSAVDVIFLRAFSLDQAERPNSVAEKTANRGACIGPALFPCRVRPAIRSSGPWPARSRARRGIPN